MTIAADIDGVVKKSVSFPRHLAAQIETRAKEENRSLSNYLQSLAIEDIRHNMQQKVAALQPPAEVPVDPTQPSLLEVEK